MHDKDNILIPEKHLTTRLLILFQPETIGFVFIEEAKKILLHKIGFLFTAAYTGYASNKNFLQKSEHNTASMYS